MGTAPIICFVRRRAGNSIGDQDGDASLFVGVWIMKTIYYPQDDILEIRLSDKPVTREVDRKSVV